MIITFWGVRGSTPVPGPDTLRYGGNTSCVSVEVDGRVLIIDAGTGIRRLGNVLATAEKEMFLVLTHLHEDHLIGFPFFAPLFHQHARLHLLDYRHDGRSYSLVDMFDGVHVPIRVTQISDVCAHSHQDGLGFLVDNGFDTRSIPLNHPGGALGYRIVHGGRTFVHLTDNELSATDTYATPFAEFVDFCRGADVLSHDAQWVTADLPAKQGWGHSTVDETCELAVAAGVGQLVLFHHDPDRTDDQLDSIEAAARERLARYGIDCVAAYEGLRLDL